MNDETSLENFINQAGMLIVCFIYVPDFIDSCCDEQAAADDETEKSVKRLIRLLDPDGSVVLAGNQQGVFSSIKNTVAEQYIRRGLENGRAKMKQNEPMRIQTAGKHRLNEKDIKAEVSGSNMMVYNLSSFQITKIKCDTANSIVEFGFRYPSVRVTGNYSIDGTVMDQKVNGNGNMDVTLKNFVVDGRVIVTENKSTGVQISTLDLMYDFSDIDAKLTGLKVGNMNEQQVQQTLNRNVSSYLKNNRSDISRRVASEIKNRLNSKLRGHSSKDVMKILSEGGLF